MVKVQGTCKELSLHLQFEQEAKPGSSKNLAMWCT